MNTVDKLNPIDPHGTHPNRDKNIIFKPHELAQKLAVCLTVIGNLQDDPP